MRRRRTPPALEIVTIRPTGLAPGPAERSPLPVPLRTGCRSGLLGVSRVPTTYLGGTNARLGLSAGWAERTPEDMLQD